MVEEIVGGQDRSVLGGQCSDAGPVGQMAERIAGRREFCRSARWLMVRDRSGDAMAMNWGAG